MESIQLKRILEAILFAAGRSVGLGEMIGILEAVAQAANREPAPVRQEVEKALEELEGESRERAGGVQLIRVAEGWSFRTAADLSPWIAALNRPKPQRLSTSGVETLAIIAYRQPVTRADIETIRGVDCAGVLKTLVERRLLRIVGRKEEPGRPLLYATTKEFLELFGLKDLTELPPLKEFEEMIKTTAGAPVEQEFTLADLAATPEELTTLEAEDRDLLTELDEGLKDLKEKDQEVEVPPPSTDHS